MPYSKTPVCLSEKNNVSEIKKHNEEEKIIALAGNPNVGKSTVFNAFTGMNQHTGNWAGKTVATAQGRFKSKNKEYILVDLPGTYSLAANSAEEEVARNFICFGNPDGVIVVCDATCLERNLNLVLQTMEISEKVIVCVNLMDEAKRKNIDINVPLIEKRLGVPVVTAVARKKNGLTDIIDKLGFFDKAVKTDFKIDYGSETEHAILTVNEKLLPKIENPLKRRFVAVKLLEHDESFKDELLKRYGNDFFDSELQNALKNAENYLSACGISSHHIKDIAASSAVKAAEKIMSGAVTYGGEKHNKTDKRIDKILTGKVSAYPVMLLLLAVIFWITISGANYPSSALSHGLGIIEEELFALLCRTGLSKTLCECVVFGIYRVLSWVISVMLPPMAIFFPLFTLLEDVGYLPRIAYCLDKPFACCGSCGKQSLTMCMGFGCNAAGVTGCRIIDSPRERLLAILTNNFVPCNGRFPGLIALLSMFFAVSGGMSTSLWLSLLLTAIIVFAVLMTLLITKFLSKTFLRGVPSSFALEMPSYRMPQVGKVIIRSVFDRTVFVLGRAIAVAAPAGLVLWLMANINIGDTSILTHCASFLDPLGRLMGLDGVILIAFILGFPANEIVIPIIIMAYMSQGTISEIGNLTEIHKLFVANGWTNVTAICTMLFSLMHWPCSTTLITVKKETGSIKWTLLSAVIPTICGMLLCIVTNCIFKILL